MKNNYRIAFALVLFSLVAHPAVGYPEIQKEQQQPKKTLQEAPTQTTAFKALCAKVDEWAVKMHNQGNINALAIAIYNQGEVYQQYYGELDPRTKQKPTDDTMYEIASISKVFTGSLVAKAVLEQKIKLSDDLRLYLPGDYPNLQVEGSPITIQNLVTHTLGLADKAPKRLSEVYQQVRAGYYQQQPFDYDMADLLDELKTVQLDKKPGTVYEYNSVGAELMAYILEQVYAKSYAELLQDFLDDLGLKDTHLYAYEQYEKQIAIGFDENGQVAPLLKNPLLGGSHGMISTLPDLTKFMRFQLESKAPFSKESTRLLFKDEIEGDDKGYFWDVGYGKIEGAYHGKTGTSNGIQSGLLICSDSNYGMIIIMNTNTEAAQGDWGQLYNQIETELIRYAKQGFGE